MEKNWLLICLIASLASHSSLSTPNSHIFEHPSGGRVVHERGAGIAYRIWPSAHFLLDFLVHNKSIWNSKIDLTDPSKTHLLELGAGVGLVGICCAAQLHVKSVTLTDVVLEPLFRSVEVNDPQIRSRIRVERLGWGEPLPSFLLSSNKSPQDESEDKSENFIPGQLLIVASDVVYWESLAAPLADTLQMLCSKPGGAVAYLSQRKRDWRTERRFFTRLLRQRGLVAEVVAQANCVELDAEAQDGEARILLASDLASSGGADRSTDDAAVETWNTRIYKISLASPVEAEASETAAAPEDSPPAGPRPFGGRDHSKPHKEKKKPSKVPPRQQKTGRRK
jgi:hypothetical protein